MKIAAQFDPSAAPSGTFQASFPNGSGRMVIFNESNYNLTLTWNGAQTYCPAWKARLYCVQTPNATIQWSQQSSLPAIGGAPINQVTVEVYTESEALPETYPVPIIRQTNIGNAVSTASGVVASAVQNDTSPAGTNIIEATVSGDGITSVQLTNDAQFTLGSSLRAGKLTVKGNGSEISGDGTHNLILESGGPTKAVEFNVNGTQKGYVDSIGLAMSSGTIRGAGQDLKLDVDSASEAVRILQNGVEIANFGAAGTVFNGSTSGTATLYQFYRGGTIKITWVVLVNFKNGTAANLDLALPVAYTTRAYWRTANTSPLNALFSGAAQNFGIITTLAAAGGSVSVQTQLNAFSFADQINNVDTVRFLGSQASTYNGIVIIEGV